MMSGSKQTYSWHSISVYRFLWTLSDAVNVFLDSM